MRWTRVARADEARRTRTAKSCGPDAAVLASSCCRAIDGNDGGKKAVHQGEHEVVVKTTAQGRPECFRWTCMLVCVFFPRGLARETAGAARTRSSLRSLNSGGPTFLQDSGVSRRENAESHSIVIARESGRSSIPEAAAMESTSLRVLDRPIKSGDDGLRMLFENW